MTWNFDISQAPKGRMVEKTFNTKDGIKTRLVFEKVMIDIATKCGLVMVSHWIPPKKEGQKGRWCGLHTTEAPIAWQPRPAHPRHFDERGHNLARLAS